MTCLSQVGKVGSREMFHDCQNACCSQVGLEPEGSLPVQASKLMAALELG